MAISAAVKIEPMEMVEIKPEFSIRVGDGDRSKDGEVVAVHKQQNGNRLVTRVFSSEHHAHDTYSPDGKVIEFGEHFYFD